MAQSLTLHGASAKVYINGQPFGIATSVSFNSDEGTHAIYGIDNDLPIELAPGPSNVTGSITCVRTRLSGGLEGRGITAPLSLMQLQKYFSIDVIDRVTQSIIFSSDRCKLVSQNWQIGAKSVISGNFSFLAINYSNELGFL